MIFNLNKLLYFITIVGVVGLLPIPNQKRRDKVFDGPVHDVTAKVLSTFDSIQDPRDGHWYPLVKIGALYWFNENLDFKSTNSDIISIGEGRKKIEVRVYSFTDSKSVCPDGWRLPTVREFDHLITLMTDTSYSGLATLSFNWTNINTNRLAFHFDQTGFLHKSKTKSKESFNLWLDDMDLEKAYHAHMYDTDRKDGSEHLTVFRHSHKNHNPIKNRKFPVRCVCSSNILP